MAAAFVLFTSCEEMLSALPGKTFYIDSNEITAYGVPLARLEIINYNKVLSMGFYEFRPPYGANVLSHNGIIKVNKFLGKVELKANSGSTEEIQISNKTIKIGSTAKQYTFDISSLL